MKYGINKHRPTRYPQPPSAARASPDLRGAAQPDHGILRPVI